MCSKGNAAMNDLTGKTKNKHVLLRIENASEPVNEGIVTKEEEPWEAKLVGCNRSS